MCFGRGNRVTAHSAASRQTRLPAGLQTLLFSIWLISCRAAAVLLSCLQDGACAPAEVSLVVAPCAAVCQAPFVRLHAGQQHLMFTILRVAHALLCQICGFLVAQLPAGRYRCSC